jgi:Ser/Thr protein kinase RdoA (MazF antagonist)
MDPKSKAIYSDAILAEAMRRYSIPEGQIELLDGFESFIYTFHKDQKDYILRLSHSLRYSLVGIEGEIDWINYLAAGGVLAARAVPALSGRLAEQIEDGAGGYFTASAFEKAPGGPASRADWEAGLLIRIGALLGQMHRLSQDYNPPESRLRRHEWDEGLDQSAALYLPPGEERVTARWNELLAELRALPRDRQSYGLIHQDMHGGNFFLDGQNITLFDFGDCCYGWFAYDLAIAFFYVIPHYCRTPEQLALARRCLEELWSGYCQENTLDPAWLENIPAFLKLREIDLYIAIHRSLDLNNLDPWCASFMAGRKEHIEDALPFVDISFRIP